VPPARSVLPSAAAGTARAAVKRAFTIRSTVKPPFSLLTSSLCSTCLGLKMKHAGLLEAHQKARPRHLHRITSLSRKSNGESEPLAHPTEAFGVVQTPLCLAAEQRCLLTAFCSAIIPHKLGYCPISTAPIGLHDRRGRGLLWMAARDPSTHYTVLPFEMIRAALESDAIMPMVSRSHCLAPNWSVTTVFRVKARITNVA